MKFNVTTMMDELNDHLKTDFNVLNSTINIKLDKHFSRLLYITKKNYSGLIDGNLYSKGLDFLKTSTLPYAAKIQKELVIEILNSKIQLNYDSILSKLKSDYYSMEFNSDNIDLITLKMRVTKHPSKYTTSSTPAKVAQWMIDNNKQFHPGIFVPIICTGHDDKGYIGVHPDSNEWKGKIDRDYIWCNQILPKISRLTEVIAPQFDWKQYDPQIVTQRLKKIDQYKKWLSDTAKNQQVIDKIQKDVVLSDKQKSELIQFASRNRAKSLW